MPRILIILLLPNKHENDTEEQPLRWINQTHERLSLMKCAYWRSLSGLQDSKNQKTVTVTIPLDDAHLFTPSVLTDLSKQVNVFRTGGNYA